MKTARRITLLVVGLAVCGFQSLPQAQKTVSTSDLLHHYVDWMNGRAAELPAISVDLAAVRRDLDRLAPNFLYGLEGNLSNPSGMPDERQRRLLVTFALEVAEGGSFRDSSGAAKLVEWACLYVRRHDPANDFDRAWQLAALSVLEGGVDPSTLAEHVDHTLRQFPGEPRLVLARGLVEEQATAPSEVAFGQASFVSAVRGSTLLAQMEADHGRAVDRALSRFREAAQVDDLRAESLLRTAHVLLGGRRYADAIASLDGVEPATTDGAVIYLARLFRGLAFEGLGRSTDAHFAYQQALEVMPGAHSATMRLAALLFREDDRDSAGRLTASLLAHDDPSHDPWWSYYTGDWRFWYQRIARVRTIVRSGQ